MSTASGHSNHRIRTRSERVASVVLRNGLWSGLLNILRNDLRYSLILAMLLMNLLVCFIIEAWKPPFLYRLNDVPNRAIVCQTPFQVASETETELARDRARWSTPPVYTLDAQPLSLLRDVLTNTIAGLVQTAEFEELVDSKVWSDFFPNLVNGTQGKESDNEASFRQLFAALKRLYGQEEGMVRLSESLKKSMEPLESPGYLTEFSQKVTDWTKERIRVLYPDGTSSVVYANEVLLGDGSRFQRSLQREFSNDVISSAFFRWFLPKLKEMGGVLKLEEGQTALAVEEAVNAVMTVFAEYPRGKVLHPAEKAIGPDSLRLLKEEYRHSLNELSWKQRVTRFFVVYLLFVLAHFLGWVYMYRRERRKPKSFWPSFMLLVYMVSVIVLTQILYTMTGTATAQLGLVALLPLLIFSQSLAITYSWELSMVLSLNLAFILVVAEGALFGPMMILVGTTIVVVEQLGRLRSRFKLISVGAIASVVAFIATIGSGVLQNRGLNMSLFQDAFFNVGWTLLAGFVMSGLLPYIERPFGVLTDMSLLELGNVSHPLLQELNRRAPATYSHSMQVGSIAEAASEAIGARSLMTRVGAYFHDIGKILKPQYFSENQLSGENVHDMLEPRMSALVIVAHVKDGADLARQHRLPKPLIDLIEQHHGTSLVSYFFGVASRQNKDNPYGQGAEESTFRYPGPKPQCKEAGILMLADAAESAVRSMGDSATPGRIENMVRQITETKLQDEQFDDSGLTLHDIRVVENSIIKSLIAIRHARIKYPGQSGSS
ncbi:MAG: HD family phosphohydrolase [Thermoguttaceae bacterium]